MRTMAEKVAVVTGSNKGIGFSIVRALCKRGVDVVYLTSRDINRGLQAIEDLKKEGFSPAFYKLDVTDKDSVKEFAEHVKAKHGGIDILINNAAVKDKEYDNTTNLDDAQYVIDVNYKSHFNIIEFLFPILKDNARVINIVSSLGLLLNIKNQFWIERLRNPNLTIEDIDAFVSWYLDSIKNNKLNADDFFSKGILSYKISKLALCALTKVEQKEATRGISINCVHPGFVKTDMTKYQGELTTDQACETPVYIALDCDQSVKGKYIWYDKSEVEWDNLDNDLFTYTKEELEGGIKLFYVE